ncbi:hypothetical protein B0T24DRAFT_622009 [Lasiosphaeria ovina]|uniref:Peptide hydrolase n=1 Tax=Lasiosphaeria ovina TaxID=92902 RepID=A0AAE0N7K3_9PEZI|nr:hypothetical protein B0T24DRAFT_622009 [Lasiosphaeria ovina]
MRFLSSISLALPALSAAATIPRGASKLKCKPLVSSEQLQGLVKLDGLLASAQKLQDFADANDHNRAFGSPGHNATVDYLYNTLSALDYYDVTKQAFTDIFSAGSAKLTVAGSDVDAHILTYTPGGTATSTLVAVSNLGCDAADFPAGAAGKVVLISRGSCTFAIKATNAKTAGAVGAIIYNNAPGTISGTLGEPFGAYAPVVSITQVEGEAILAKVAAGPVEVILDVNAVVEERVTFNVIAETKQGDHDNVLVLGGHTDSVSDGPGINDDGSGTVGILNVAVALSQFKVKNAVRFGFWSGEEFGLLGSNFYVEQLSSNAAELAKIRAYLNFDMIASPNPIYGIYDGDGSGFGTAGPAGSDIIEKDFEDFYAAKGSAHVPSEFDGRSDYLAFIDAGIPAGGLFTGAEGIKTVEEAALFGGEAGQPYDVNYHGPGDDVTNLNLDAFLLNSKSIANSVAKYALSFDSLPPVAARNSKRADVAPRSAKRKGRPHGLDFE